MSGRRIGGSGRLMSSNAMVSFIPGRSSSRSGGESIGCVERGFDGGGLVVDAGQDLRRVDDAGAEREPFEAKRLAGVHEQRRGPFVDLEDEAGTGHERILPVLVGSSKTTRPVPSRPADSAWSSASRQRSSG